MFSFETRQKNKQPRIVWFVIRWYVSIFLSLETTFEKVFHVNRGVRDGNVFINEMKSLISSVNATFLNRGF